MLGYEAGKAFEEKKPDREMESPNRRTHTNPLPPSNVITSACWIPATSVSQTVLWQGRRRNRNPLTTGLRIISRWRITPREKTSNRLTARSITLRLAEYLNPEIRKFFRIFSRSTEIHPRRILNRFASSKRQAHSDRFKQLWDIDQPAPPVSDAMPVFSRFGSRGKILPEQPAGVGNCPGSIGGLSGQSGLVGTQPAPPPPHLAPLHYQFQMPPRRSDLSVRLCCFFPLLLAPMPPELSHPPPSQLTDSLTH